MASLTEESGDGPLPLTLLKTSIAIVQSKLTKRHANLLLDEGSQRSFITARLAQQLRLQPIWRKGLILNGFLSQSNETQFYDVAQFSIVGLNGSPIVIQAIILDEMICPLEDFHRKEVVALPHLQNLHLAHPVTNSKFFDVDVLIGANYYWTLVGNTTIRGPGPTAVASKVGYLVSGPLLSAFADSPKPSVVLNISTMKHFDIAQFWTLESLGIQPETESTSITETYQSECIEFSSGKYIARLPWKKDHPELLPNFFICERRTRSSIKQLFKTPSMLTSYDSIIRDQLQRGFIEKVPVDELHNINSVHYIPHFGVKKDSPATPLRVVYDCSCKTKAGISLNDCLETGPPLQNQMLDILLRFRVHRVGLSADIEKAFHQIGLQKEDRNFIRFLWLSDITNIDSNMDCYRFRVIPFGARCSPFILLSVIKYHLKQTSTATAVDMDLDIYVDNLMTGSETTEEAIEFYQEANTTLRKAGLHLQSWGSNSSIIDDRAKSDGVNVESHITKTLGLTWDRSCDTLSLPEFHLSKFCYSKTSKRDVHGGVSTVYDPLGFISPVTISAKILIQELWKSKFGWDDHLPAIFRERWRGVASAIEGAKPSIARSYLGSLKNILNVHIFVDASQQAYGAVAYASSEAQVAFMLSKSRVAPLSGGTKDKPLTLPQLELISAVIGARLAESILKALDPLGLKPAITLWSDSQIVLHWLAKSDHKSHFVKNRATTVQDFVHQHNAKWRYCPTKENPADLLTRGITLHQFQSYALWLYGPTWLTTRADLPSWNPELSDKVLLITEPVTPVVSIDEHFSTGLQSILDIKQYHWTSLMRVTALVRRFISHIQTRQPSQRKSGPISTTELQTAEKTWIKLFQKQFFKVEMDYLKKTEGDRPALDRQLDLFIDNDGMIRCKGRLEFAQISRDAKHPILLPRFSEITKLLILFHHEVMLHSGVSITVSSIRQLYWIPSIRQRVKT